MARKSIVVDIMENKEVKKKRVMSFIIVLWCLIFFIIIYYYVRYLSFSRFNVVPQKIVEKYLTDTYYGEFTLKNTDFYKEKGYYIWKYSFENEKGVEFCEYYKHPYERALDQTGVYWYFSIKSDKRIEDFYWVQNILVLYEDELKVEKYQLDSSPHNGRVRYFFDLEKDDMSKIADTISSIYEIAFNNTKKPENCDIGCEVAYQENYVSTIGAGYDDEIYQYIGSDKKLIYDYVYNRINEEWLKYRGKHN